MFKDDFCHKCLGLTVSLRASGPPFTLVTAAALTHCLKSWSKLWRGQVATVTVSVQQTGFDGEVYLARERGFNHETWGPEGKLL